jgi:hypothetical protein
MASELSGQVAAGIVTTEVEVGDDGEANWPTLLTEFDKIALHG